MRGSKEREGQWEGTRGGRRGEHGREGGKMGRESRKEGGEKGREKMKGRRTEEGRGGRSPPCTIFCLYS